LKTILEAKYELKELESFAKSLAEESKIGDIFLLKGDLGVGKTTFSRFFINSVFDKNEISRPDVIQSPSFPIAINYPLNNYEIYHYDLFRLNNTEELIEIGIFDNLKKHISLIEWPEIILNNFMVRNYYLLNFDIVNLKTRSIKLQYFIKN
tara:strand:+ start:1865 stop:2317 length:453 start_codon:yes stop_codon:yes gene_type:complete